MALCSAVFLWYRWIAKRKTALHMAIAKLKSLDIIDSHTDPRTKASLYKTYLRPVTLHGIENFDLRKHERDFIKNLESKTIKKLLNISTRCHHSDLFKALNIMDTVTILETTKLKFFIRLSKNEFTKKNNTTTD